jgi:zinc/manganese transport system substrate-binding protein
MLRYYRRRLAAVFDRKEKGMECMQTGSSPSVSPRRRWLAACLLGTLATLGSAMPVRAEQGGPLPVVASFSILADLVRQVGGDRVAVEALVGPDVDTHVYQPTPADARRVAQARVVFVNGWGFEGWMERLVRNAAYRGPVVTVTDGLPPLRVPAAGHQHQHQHAHDHDHGDIDPHAWQNVAHARHMVQRIAAALCEADAAGCASYRERAAAYGRELEALDAEIRAAWAGIAPAQRKVLTSHDAFGHYAQAYGVRFLAVQGVSADSEPSAAAVARLIRTVQREKVRAIFVERLGNPRVIERIARETGVRPAAEPLYADALSAPGGPASSYVALMRHNTRAMVQAISQASR